MNQHEEDVDLFNSSHNEPLFGGGNEWMDNISTTTTATTTPSILIEHSSPQPNQDEHNPHSLEYSVVDKNSSFQFKDHATLQLDQTAMNAPIHHHLLNDMNTASTTASILSPQSHDHISHQQQHQSIGGGKSSKKRSRSPQSDNEDNIDDSDQFEHKKLKSEDDDYKMDQKQELFQQLHHHHESSNSNEMSFSEDSKGGDLTTPTKKKKQKQSSSQKKKRLTWTPELHTRFIDAVNQLGIHNAAPKTIHQYMNVPYLTTEHIKSHLQKYRLQMKKQKSGGSSRLGCANEIPEASDDASTASEPTQPRRSSILSPGTPTPHAQSFTALNDPPKTHFPNTSREGQGMFGMPLATATIPNHIQSALLADDGSNLDNYTLILNYMTKEDREIGRMYEESQRQMTSSESFRFLLIGFKLGLLSAMKFPQDSSFNLTPTKQIPKDNVASPFATPNNMWNLSNQAAQQYMAHNQDNTPLTPQPTRIQLKQNSQFGNIPQQLGASGFMLNPNENQFFHQSQLSGNNGNGNRANKIEISQLGGSAQCPGLTNGGDNNNSNNNNNPYRMQPGNPSQQFILFGSGNGYEGSGQGGNNRFGMPQTQASSQS